MDFVERFSPGEIIGLTSVLGVVILIAISIISGSIRDYRERSYHHELKRELLQRGFSADEIIRVCQEQPSAGSGSTGESGDIILELSSLLASYEEKPEIMRRIMATVTPLPQSSRLAVFRAISRLLEEGVLGESLIVSVEAYTQGLAVNRKNARETDHEINLEMRRT